MTDINNLLEEAALLKAYVYEFTAPDNGYTKDNTLDAKRAFEVVNRLRNALAQAQKEREWQPIESAPKDGSYILVHQSGALEPSMTVCSYDDDWWYCCDGKNPEIPLRGIEPTHWMPLPTPPEKG